MKRPRLSPLIRLPAVGVYLFLAAMLLVCFSPAQARAMEALAHLTGRQPVASINQHASTIPLTLSPYSAKDFPAPPQYVAPASLQVPRSALPSSVAGKLGEAPEKSLNKENTGNSRKGLTGDTSRGAPKLIGFKPLNRDVFFAPPPYLQNMWDEVQSSHDPERTFGKGQTLMNAFRKEQWANIVATWNTMGPDKKLRVINGFFNNLPSKSDLQNYGKKEYWATPEEMIKKGSGDCEDYAIIKYMALRYLSWPVEDMWIVLVQDRQKKTHHAVLAARYGSQTFILDNLSKPRYLLIPEGEYMKRYMPFYAINNHSSWIFAMPKKSKNAPHSPAILGHELGVAENDLVMKR